MKTLTEFLASDRTYAFPAPGGSILDGSDRSNCDADLYLSELAALLKKRKFEETVVEILHRKISQIRLQEHYGPDDDAKLIERLGSWAQEFN